MRPDPWAALDTGKFERWQENLLALLNEPKLRRWARWRMGLHAGQVGRREDVIAISPHRFLVSVRGGYRATFMPQPALQLSLYRAFWPAFWAMHAYDWLLPDRRSERWVQSLIRPMRPAFEGFGLATLTAYSQAGGGGSNVTCDSPLSHYGVDESFALVHNGTGGSLWAAPTYTTAIVELVASATSGQFQTIQRVIGTFNTSAIGSNSIISAVLSVWGSSAPTYQLGGNMDLHVVAAAPANPANIAGGDFTNVGSVDFGSTARTAFSTSGYNDVALNASGVANINKTGVTGFGWVLGDDLNGSFTGSWVSADQNSLAFYQADNGSNAPKLVVTYGPVSIPVPPGAIHLTGKAPSLTQSIAVPTTALHIAGQVPSLLIGRVISVPAGTLRITGKAPALTMALAVPARSLHITGKAPSLALTLRVPHGSLRIAGQVPMVLNTPPFPYWPRVRSR